VNARASGLGRADTGARRRPLRRVLLGVAKTVIAPRQRIDAG